MFFHVHSGQASHCWRFVGVQFRATNLSCSLGCSADEARSHLWVSSFGNRLHCDAPQPLSGKIRRLALVFTSAGSETPFLSSGCRMWNSFAESDLIERMDRSWKPSTLAPASCRHLPPVTPLGPPRCRRRCPGQWSQEGRAAKPAGRNDPRHRRVCKCRYLLE